MNNTGTETLKNGYEPVIGLEIHAELETESKMFCSCPVVDVVSTAPNTAVCPVCSGMPGVLPVANERAVEFALRVALALNCEIAPTSVFARKNYFYPDLPKGYQISQYEQPLAKNGRITIFTSHSEHEIRIRRVHLEEDTGRLTHTENDGERYSLVDLNRAGVPLLEIVSEPDLHSAEEVRAYATSLRAILRYLGVNNGDMQKGVLRIEPNVSVRLKNSDQLGTRTEIKNLNSFHSLEYAVEFEIQRQITLLRSGKTVHQETLGWDDKRGTTLPQRSKEEAHDYRYFPEPDLPPLVIDPDWLDRIRSTIPELPAQKQDRFQAQYQLNSYDANVLIADPQVADYFEKTNQLTSKSSPKLIANWITGDLFSLLKQNDINISDSLVDPSSFSSLLDMVANGEITQRTAKLVLAEIFTTGNSARQIVSEEHLQQISNTGDIADLVKRTLTEHPAQVADYLGGKKAVFQWLFGQIMRNSGGKANPQIVRSELNKQLSELGTRTDVSEQGQKPL